MKIIQTFWSKPFAFPAANSLEARFQGGFPNDSQFIYTWALSLLSIKEVFSHVHLNTDEKGKKAWIDFFEFPYDSYSTEMDSIEEFPSELWSTGKLLTYARIKEPFVHFDVDVVLGKHFDKDKFEQELFVEFKYDDCILKRYDSIIHKLLNYEIQMSPEFKEIIAQSNFSYNDFNLGITGGYDYDFFNRYAQNALNNLKLNIPFLQKIDGTTKSFLNCFFEQFCFYETSRIESKCVEKILENTLKLDFDYQKHKIDSGYGNFDFVHFHGGYKRLYPELSGKWLKQYYPDYYKNINEKIAYINSQQ